MAALKSERNTLNKCFEAERSTLVLLQLWVMRLQTSFYIVMTPGITTSSGKKTYIVMGQLLLSHANDFLTSI
jgi:hypothetical protein